MIYDVIIVGAGAAGLFAGINLDKKLNKLILEKTEKPGTKVLLSGGERANVSNADIEVERDYFGQNKKALISIFKRYNQWDIMSFFTSVGVNIVEEDRGRLILESGDSSELLNVLLKETKDNNCELKINSEVIKISPLLTKEGVRGWYEIKLSNGKIYQTKNVIISSGGKSFFQVGTTGDGYNFAKDFGLKIITPTRGLCGMSTKKDLSEVSGISSIVEVKLVDKKQPLGISFADQPHPNPLLRGEGIEIRQKNVASLSSKERKFKGEVVLGKGKQKIIYQEKGPILFTHFGLSGPIIFNVSTVIGEYLNSLNLDEYKFESYILENLSIDLVFDLDNTAKRLIKFFELSEDNNLINLELQNWRSWKEAKATGGGVDIDCLDNNLQSKEHRGLYFVGEVVDITGKTGGFNLQWAWSSGFVAGQSIKKEDF